MILMYNVLICDDQPEIVNALKIYLKPEGYGLFEANDGAESVQIVKSRDIHLVLLDVMMPNMDGITNGISATEFGATAACNRAQVVTFLYRAFGK